MKQIEERIELTEGELKAIKIQLAGEFEIWNVSKTVADDLMSVIDKANALMRKYDLFDDLGSSLIQWYYDLYLTQNKKE